MPTNNTDYSCYIKIVELVYKSSYGIHIMPLVINSLRAHTEVCTESILRNQVHLHSPDFLKMTACKIVCGKRMDFEVRWNNSKGFNAAEVYNKDSS